MPLPQSFLDVIEQPQQATPYVWLVEIELDRGSVVLPPVLMRVTNEAEVVTWPVGDPAASTWDPFPFAFSGFEQNQEGDLPQVQLSVDNTSRTLMRYLHDGGGLEGHRVTLFLIPRSGLSIAYPDHEYQRWDFEVETTQATDEAIGIRLERPNFFARTSPVDRYVQGLCRWEYGSRFCGYVLNEFAAYARCPKTIGACIERGVDLGNRGLPQVLPGNFGGKPGISRLR